MNNNLKRVIVIGTSGCGKSVFAGRLARKLSVQHIELDQIYWQPGWTPRPEIEFLRLVREAAESEYWIIDGNYSIARDLVWPRATAVIWLNYGFPTVLFRILRRTIHRTVTGETLFAGNTESFSRSFLSRDSILLWAVSTYRRRRKEYEAIKYGNDYPLLEWFEFQDISEAEHFLHRLQG